MQSRVAQRRVEVEKSVFFRAGAVFGEVGVSLFVAGAAFCEILGDSRGAKCCICPYKMRLEDGTSKVSEAAGAR